MVEATAERDIRDDEEIRVDDERRRQVDGSQITSELDIDKDEIAWRKSFTDFDRTDEQALAEIVDVLEQTATELPDELETHVHDHEEALVYLSRSTKGFEQLKQAHRGYLKDLGSGSYGQEYFDRRARIGRIHDMLGLGPKVYLGAYSVYFGGLVDAVAEEMKDRTAADSLDTGEAIDELVEYVMALFKVINLDQQVVMDTYIHSANQELQSELDRQESVAEEVRGRVEDNREQATDIAETTDEIEEFARCQEESVGEISQEVSDMSATVEEIASTAGEVAKTSSRTEALADEGRDAATDAIDTMESIDGSTADVAEQVEQLEARIGEIDEVVEVINDIADQTNLLALNASIEAARAGEAGDGFAVVADEVKSLAEESQSHAGDIEALVGEITDDTEEAVANLEAMTAQVDDGIDQVEAAMEKLQEIAEAIGKTNRGIQEVSDATDSQAASTEEVASMVDDLVEQTERIADGVTDISEANDHQAEEIIRIDETVQQLSE